MYLGLDIGTSGVKAALVNDEGLLVAQADAPLQVMRPQPLWSEQDPQHWWHACAQAIANLRDASSAVSAVRGVGLSGQMHGATLMDRNGAPLRPCILWNDGRSFEECEDLEREVPDLRERSGNLAMPGFTAPKLRWVARHEPHVFEQVAKVLLPKDYVAYRLTGEWVTDRSDASGTLWLNPATRDWDDPLLNATGLTRDHMPRLLDGCDVVGDLSASSAAALGLPQVPVVAGAGDNAAGAVGVGATSVDDGFVSLGTSGVIFVVSGEHRACPERTVHAFCHCLPDRWHQMTVTLSAANSLAWLARMTGRDVPSLLASLDESQKRETDVVFLPYLSGERSPHNDPYAVGQFHGLRDETDVNDLTLAVLEGVAYAFRDGLDALSEAGTQPAELMLIGGGARSAIWRQILADVLEVPLSYHTGADVGPALGAARLAAIGVQRHGSLESRIASVATRPPLDSRYQPNRDTAAYHHASLARFRALYTRTHDLVGLRA